METTGLSSPINIYKPALMSTSQNWKKEWFVLYHFVPPPQAEYIHTHECGSVQRKKEQMKLM